MPNFLKRMPLFSSEKNYCLFIKIYMPLIRISSSNWFIDFIILFWDFTLTTNTFYIRKERLLATLYKWILYPVADRRWKNLIIDLSSLLSVFYQECISHLLPQLAIMLAFLSQDTNQKIIIFYTRSYFYYHLALSTWVLNIWWLTLMSLLLLYFPKRHSAIWNRLQFSKSKVMDPLISF